MFASQTSGADVLQTVGSNNTIEVALHHGDTITKWQLPKTAHTRILYKLANRATHAKYSSFSLRPLNSMVQIPDSTHLTLGSTALGIGGAIEIHRGVVHSRRPQVITVGFKNSEVTQTIMLPANASTLALISHIRAPDGGRLSDIMLWYALLCLSFFRTNMAKARSPEGRRWCSSRTDCQDERQHSTVCYIVLDFLRMSSVVLVFNRVSEKSRRKSTSF
jgi:hypothetical protein